MQAQFVFIACSLKWRTGSEFQVPDTLEARSIFWTVNLSLVIVPHLFALYCHRYEISDYYYGFVYPTWGRIKRESEDGSYRKTESIRKEVKSVKKSPKKIEAEEKNTRRVTRSQKKLF